MDAPGCDDNPRLAEVLSEALRGTVTAQFDLAVILEEEEEDFDLATSWYQKAAQQGHSEAAFRAGILCLRKGSRREPEAAYWFLQAANAGHASAQFNLALVHEKGLGVKVDPDEALKWLRIAARQGHVEAKEKLARLNEWLGLFS